MEHLNSDLLIHIISYLPLEASNRLSVTSTRWFYCVHQFRKILGPELVSSSSKQQQQDQSLLSSEKQKSVYEACFTQLRRPPNLALTFQSQLRKPLWEELETRLPCNAVVLGAVAGSIQANVCCGSDKTTTVDCESEVALLLGSLDPETTHMAPFYLDDETMEELEQQLASDNDHDEKWKVFILYVCGDGYYAAESLVGQLQAKYPDAAIVGGICDSGYVSSPSRTRQQQRTRQSRRNAHNVRLSIVESGIFGVAFRGNVPLRSIVSRGVKSLIATAPGESSPWQVQHTQYSRPGDEHYMFGGNPDDLQPYHRIKSLQNMETGKVSLPVDFFMALPTMPEYVGVKRPGSDGFELHVVSPISLQCQNIILMTDGSPEQAQSLEHAHIDLLALDAEACLEHMDRTLGKLKEQTKDEVILGGVMFSCSGRGPGAQCMLGESMADATRFHKHFPNIPCLGFYAGGEIGPMALAGNKDIFQTGKAAVQGFTAVFALFIVPVVEPGSFQMDDSDTNVRDFLQAKCLAMRK